jgi:hypothetical protein
MLPARQAASFRHPLVFPFQRKNARDPCRILSANSVFPMQIDANHTASMGSLAGTA